MELVTSITFWPLMDTLLTCGVAQVDVTEMLAICTVQRGSVMKFGRANIT